jgi:hypothetical protein
MIGRIAERLEPRPEPRERAGERMPEVARAEPLANLHAGLRDAREEPHLEDAAGSARRRGHRVVDGLGMLLEQAGYGFQKWFGGNPRVTPELRKILEDDIRATTAPPAPTPLAAGR